MFLTLLDHFPQHDPYSNNQFIFKLPEQWRFSHFPLEYISLVSRVFLHFCQNVSFINLILFLPIRVPSTTQLFFSLLLPVMFIMVSIYHP